MGFFSNFAAMRASQGIPDQILGEPVSDTIFSPTLFEDQGNSTENVTDDENVTFFSNLTIYELPERSGVRAFEPKETSTIVVYYTNASGLIYQRVMTKVTEIVDRTNNYSITYSSYTAIKTYGTTVTYWIYPTTTTLYTPKKTTTFIYVVVMWVGVIFVGFALLGLSCFCNCSFDCSGSNSSSSHPNTTSNISDSTRSPQDLTPEEIELAAIREQNNAPPATTYNYTPTVAPPPSTIPPYSDVKKPETPEEKAEKAKIAQESNPIVTDPASNPYMNVQTEDEKWD